MVAGDRVDVLPRGQSLARPQGVVPAATDDPVSRRRGLRVFGDALLHLGQRFHADQIDLQILQAAGRQMQVRVVEAGHHEVAARDRRLRCGRA